MAWDIGYQGDCPNCGEHLHQFSTDRPGRSAMWLRCPTCLNATSVSIEDNTEAQFWSQPHPCPACGTAREPWSASRCPRCGQEDAGQFFRMAD